MVSDALGHNLPAKVSGELEHEVLPLRGNLASSAHPFGKKLAREHVDFEAEVGGTTPGLGGEGALMVPRNGVARPRSLVNAVVAGERLSLRLAHNAFDARGHVRRKWDAEHDGDVPVVAVSVAGVPELDKLDGGATRHRGGVHLVVQLGDGQQRATLHLALVSDSEERHRNIRGQSHVGGRNGCATGVDTECVRHEGVPVDRSQK